MPTSRTDLLRRFRGLTLAAGRPKTLLGAGTEVVALRDYAPGDDYRHIDWIRCARHDELMTKVFAGEEDLRVDLLLDCSPSMGLGRPSKFSLARQMAAMLGYAALERLDRVSLTAFSDRIVDTLGPIRHKLRFGRLMGFLDGLELHGSRTDLVGCAERFAARRQRPGPLVVISDLYDRQGFRPCFDLLRHRGYDLRVIHLTGRQEAEPGLLGDIELLDVEQGTTQMVTVTEQTARRYRQAFDRFCGSVRDYCRGHGVPLVQLASDMPENEALAKVLGIR